MSLEVFSSSIKNKSNRGSDERESSSNKTLSISRAGNTNDKGSSEEEPSEEIRLAKKVKISHRGNAESYPRYEV